MEIDARGLKDPEPLRLLKEALQSEASVGETIHLLVDTKVMAAKARTFAAFTGSLCDIEEKDSYFQVSIDRMCNCG